MKPGNSKTIDEITRILRTPSSEMSDEEQLLQVMKYVDNLIAWADNLFQQDTVESINEATKLYVWAASILGTPNSREDRGAEACSALFDTVADRLFKIRHGMNMAGVVRPPALSKSPAKRKPSKKKTKAQRRSPKSHSKSK